MPPRSSGLARDREHPLRVRYSLEGVLAMVLKPHAGGRAGQPQGSGVRYSTAET